jgi:hypothetical protein
MIEPLKRILSVPLAAILLVYDAFDAALGPIVRPALAYLASLRPFVRLGAAIGRLPPYAALVLLAVPFAVIEPFKALSLYWIAIGHVAVGAAALVAAHLASILISERIFHAARAPLMTIAWFAAGYRFITALRDRALAWVRSTAAWRAAAAFAADLRARFPFRT